MFSLVQLPWAGPYVNVENNAEATKVSYLGSTTDLHVGYEGGDGNVWVLPARWSCHRVAPDGGDVDLELSGKIGGSVQATEHFGVYGEISFITAEDEPSIGTKIGAKWSF